jgi:hypothetical protein
LDVGFGGLALGEKGKEASADSFANKKTRNGQDYAHNTLKLLPDKFSPNAGGTGLWACRLNRKNISTSCTTEIATTKIWFKSLGFCKLIQHKDLKKERVLSIF